jgi:hypothetical protein
VLQFLQHDGYVETARAFADEILSEKEALSLDASSVVDGINMQDDEDANRRQRKYRQILMRPGAHARQVYGELSWRVTSTRLSNTQTRIIRTY